jgi:hypothetical protein
MINEAPSQQPQTSSHGEEVSVINEVHRLLLFRHVERSTAARSVLANGHLKGNL